MADVAFRRRGVADVRAGSAETTSPALQPVAEGWGLLVADDVDTEAQDQDQAAGLHRVARGLLDCARALTSLTEQVGRMEARVERIGPVGPGDGAPMAALTEQTAGLERRIRALESRAVPVVAAPSARARGDEQADDRLVEVAQRLDRLEALPLAVAQLQRAVVPREAMATLVTEAVARQVQRLAAEVTTLPDDIAGLHLELDSVAEVVAAGNAAVYRELDSVAQEAADANAVATQSLARVKALERAVHELRRRLERPVMSSPEPEPERRGPDRPVSHVDAAETGLRRPGAARFEGRLGPPASATRGRLASGAPRNGAASGGAAANGAVRNGAALTRTGSTAVAQNAGAAVAGTGDDGRATDVPAIAAVANDGSGRDGRVTEGGTDDQRAGEGSASAPAAERRRFAGVSRYGGRPVVPGRQPTSPGSRRGGAHEDVDS